MDMKKLVASHVEELRAKLTRAEIALAVLEELELRPSPPTVDTSKPKRKRQKSAIGREAMKSMIIDLLAGGTPMASAEIAASLSITDRPAKKSLWTALFELKRDGRLDRNEDRQYSIHLTNKETVNA